LVLPKDKVTHCLVCGVNQGCCSVSYEQEDISSRRSGSISASHKVCCCRCIYMFASITLC